MKIKYISAALLAALLLSGCGAGSTLETEKEAESPVLTEAPATEPAALETTEAPETEPTLSPAEEILSNMTLRE